MLSGLLATTVTVGNKEITTLTIPESLIYALIGFIVTFIGIIILIFLVWLVGQIIRKVNLEKRPKTSEEQKTEKESNVADEIGIDTRLAIIAAIAAYYENENSSCEFKVKRIKRL